MDDLNIKINDDISEDLLNMKLADMFCKHVIRRNPDGIQIKADKLYTESLKLGYNFCEWGVHSGHPSDISFHTVIIPGLFEPPVRTLRATIPENESHIFR